MKQSVDLAIGSGSNVDAVARMKMTGDLLSSYQAMLWAADFAIKTSITGLRVVANGFGVTKLAGVSLDGMANALWDWALQVPIPVIAKLAEYTGFLGYFGVALPSLPYTVFMITVVGWILGWYRPRLPRLFGQSCTCARARPSSAPNHKATCSCWPCLCVQPWQSSASSRPS
jgi:hypothetical protein